VRWAVVFVALTACGAAPPSTRTERPDAGATCTSATYVCSVLGAWAGTPARGRVQVDTGEPPASGEIVGAGFRCTLVLASLEPDHHLLRAECEADGAREVFELHEPTRTFRTSRGFTLEPASWYAQEGHVAGDCDTCRAIDYCEGPDVE
jgi:hypothetical protein